MSCVAVTLEDYLDCALFNSANTSVIGGLLLGSASQHFSIILHTDESVEAIALFVYFGGGNLGLKPFIILFSRSFSFRIFASENGSARVSS